MRDVIRTTGSRLSEFITRTLARYSIPALRVSLGLVFLGFGLLKFIPGASPAEDLVKQTMDALTLGVIPGSLGLVMVAMLETAVGITLITGRYLRAGLALLGLTTIGILSPLVLFPDELFGGPSNAPTLTGQYVLKDVIILGAGLVISARALGENPVIPDDVTDSRTDSEDETVS